MFNKLENHYRIAICFIIAIIVFFLTKKNFSPAINYMFGWIAFAFSHLTFSWITILTSHPKNVKHIAKKQDSSRSVIFLFVIVASLISLFAIIYLLKTLPQVADFNRNFHIALSAASVICSWLLIHTIFTLRYAHLYYTSRQQEQEIKKLKLGGLDFPDPDEVEEPDYLDFAYFSFVIGMTFQVSDVVITSRHIRRIALLHALLSFIFNTVIVALSINIVASLMQK